MKLDINLTKQLITSDLLEEYFKPRTNPYKDTIFEHYYQLNNKIKGSMGEKLATVAANHFNRNVKPRTSSGHDVIIDGKKTEVKVSLAMMAQEDVFTFNHLALGKDYDRILLVGLSVSNTYMVWLEKSDFTNFINQGKYFAAQQGGKKANNDDYMFVTKNSWQTFLLEPCVKDFSKVW